MKKLIIVSSAIALLLGCNDGKNVDASEPEIHPSPEIPEPEVPQTLRASIARFKRELQWSKCE